MHEDDAIKAAIERHVLGMTIFVVMLFAGLLLVNYFEPCAYGRPHLAAPCYDPDEDRRAC